MADERIIAVANTAIVFDPQVAPQVEAAWFEPQYWREQRRLTPGDGGRGGVAYIDTPSGDAVLRHYHRGGHVAALLGDRYLWRGRDRSRSFAEFRLLQSLRALQLPVPRAIAACSRRIGWYYTADLMTARIANARTLAQCLTAGTMDDAMATRTGATIAQFHLHGVFHADLNAHNVLVNADGIHVIDFDRGLLRAPAQAWQQANLKRLRRSLLKLSAARSHRAPLAGELWAALLRGYRQGLAA